MYHILEERAVGEARRARVEILEFLLETERGIEIVGEEVDVGVELEKCVCSQTLDILEALLVAVMSSSDLRGREVFAAAHRALVQCCDLVVALKLGATRSAVEAEESLEEDLVDVVLERERSTCAACRLGILIVVRKNAVHEGGAVVLRADHDFEVVEGLVSVLEAVRIEVDDFTPVVVRKTTHPTDIGSAYTEKSVFHQESTLTYKLCIM